MTDISIEYFRFVPTRYGQWRVSYKTPRRSKTWSKVISNPSLIDATRGSEKPLRRDLVKLRNLVKYKNE